MACPGGCGGSKKSTKTTPPKTYTRQNGDIVVNGKVYKVIPPKK